MTRTLTAFLFVAACAAAADVTGVVIADHDGAPVVAAAVTLRQGTKVVAELEADDQGKFRAPNVVAGSYTVSIAKANFAPSERRVTVQAGERTITVRLMRYGVITGSVIDTAGQGVRSAVVAAIPVAPDGSIRSLRTFQLSGVAADARGRFRVHSLKPGSYVVAMLLGAPRDGVGISNFIAPDTSLGNDIQLFPTTAHPQVFRVRGGEEYKADFTVYKGQMFSVRGTVSGIGENTNAQVQMLKADMTILPLAGAGAPKSGEFQFQRVPPGSYRLVAMSRPSASLQVVDGKQVVVQSPGTPTYGETTVVVGAQDVTDVLIVTSPLSLKARAVYEPAASCPKQATIGLSSVLGVSNTNTTLQAGVEQTLTLNPSPYWAEITTPNTHCYLVQGEIDFRQTPSDGVVHIVASPLGVIKGKVGSPLSEDYEVVLTPADGSAPKSLIPDAESRFAFVDLLPGRYKVSVYKADSDRSTTEEAQELEVTSGASLEIEFAGIR